MSESEAVGLGPRGTPRYGSGAAPTVFYNVFSAFDNLAPSTPLRT